MLKILQILLVLSLYSLTVFSQNNEINYSESIPYKTSKIEDKDIKSRKGKKSGQNSQDKTFYVPIFVYDKDEKPVKDLSKADFKLFINNEEKDFSIFDSQEKIVNVRLILDISNSTAYMMKDMQKFARLFADILNSQSRMQIITIDEKIKLLNDFTNDKAIISASIDKLNKQGSGSAIYDSIDFLFGEQTNQDNNLTVFLSDGVDTTSQKSTYNKSLKKVEKSNSMVYSFFLNTFDYMQKNQLSNSRNYQIYKNEIIKEYRLGNSYLIDLANISGGKYFEVKDLSKINESDFSYLKQMLYPHYYIGFQISDAYTYENNQIKVRINRPNLIVKARGSFSY